MATLTPTAAEVLLVTGGASTVNKQYNAGAVLAAGDAVSLNGSNLWVLAANGTDAILAGANGLGIVLHAATVGQPCSVAVTGATVDLGSSSGAKDGHLYAVSGTGGEIVDAADVTTGDFFSGIGYGIGTSDYLIISVLRVPTVMVA